MEIKDGRPDQVIESYYRCPQWTADQGCPLHGESCDAARAAGLIADRPSTPAGLVRVVVTATSPKGFACGVQSARCLRGKYDPSTKTWLIPAQMAQFIGPQNPGLAVVGR